jgi:hypothetical protein
MRITECKGMEEEYSVLPAEVLSMYQSQTISILQFYTAFIIS